MIKLCVFDLDGTTVNSLSSIAHFANETLKRFGQRTFEVDAYRHLAGGGAKKLWRNLLEACGAPEALYAPMLKDWLTTYDADFMYLTEPYAGIEDMLRSLKALGCHTAIVTNKDGRIADKLCNAFFGTEGKLLDVCISDYPGMTLKPAPDELNRLMARYGVQPHECIYCGDHMLDMTTGNNAHVHAIGVTWGFHDRQELAAAGAEQVVDDPDEMIKYVQNYL